MLITLIDILFYHPVCDARWLRIANCPMALDGKYYVIFNCVSYGIHCFLYVMHHLAEMCLSELLIRRIENVVTTNIQKSAF